MDLSRYCSMREFARLTGLTEGYVRQLVLDRGADKEMIPSEFIPEADNKRMIPRDEIERWKCKRSTRGRRRKSELTSV